MYVFVCKQYIHTTCITGRFVSGKLIPLDRGPFFFEYDSFLVLPLPSPYSQETSNQTVSQSGQLLGPGEMCI